jgi:hypothetical protein
MRGSCQDATSRGNFVIRTQHSWKLGPLLNFLKKVLPDLTAEVLRLSQSLIHLETSIAPRRRNVLLDK